MHLAFLIIFEKYVGTYFLTDIPPLRGWEFISIIPIATDMSPLQGLKTIFHQFMEFKLQDVPTQVIFK